MADMTVWGRENKHVPEVIDVGTGQGLQFLIPVPNRLSTNAAIEFELLNALQELDHLLSDFFLLLTTLVDSFAQAVNFQRAQLTHNKKRTKSQTTSAPINYFFNTLSSLIRWDLSLLRESIYLVSHSICQLLRSL